MKTKTSIVILTLLAVLFFLFYESIETAGPIVFLAISLGTLSAFFINQAFHDLKEKVIIR